MAMGAKGGVKPRRWCTVYLVCIGLLCWLLAIYGTVLYSSFTPVYRTISCGFVGASVQDISLGDILSSLPGLLPPGLLPGLSGSPQDISFSILVEMQCQNPNPYEFSIATKEAGGIYLGSDRVRVGSMATLPTSSMPAAGTGTLEAKSSVKLDAKDTPQLISDLLRDLFAGADIPIWMEPNEEVKIKVPVLFQSVISMGWSKKCGMNFANPAKLIFNPNNGIHSPLACADSFDEIQIPSTSEGKKNDDLSLEAVNIDSSQLHQAETLKNAVLIPMMAVFYPLGLICFLFAYRRCFVVAEKDVPPAASAAPARNVVASSEAEATVSV